jgi:hypothetical protein
VQLPTHPRLAHAILTTSELLAALPSAATSGGLDPLLQSHIPSLNLR